MVVEFHQRDFDLIRIVLRLNSDAMRTDTGEINLYRRSFQARKWVFNLTGAGVAIVWEPLPINPAIHRDQRPHNPLVKVVRVQASGKLAEIVGDLRKSIPSRKRNKPNRATRISRRSAGPDSNKKQRGRRKNHFQGLLFKNQNASMGPQRVSNKQSMGGGDIDYGTEITNGCKHNLTP